MSKVCVIVGAAEAGQVVCPEGALVIAADGGYETLARQGVAPAVAVGDFDSLGYRPPVNDIVYHPPEKDDTDMMMSVREGLKRGCDTFLLYGGMGGSLDHTLANLQTLLFLKNHGARGFLLGDGIVLTVVQNETMHFGKAHQGVLSVFCLGGRAEGVTLTGLHYPLQNAVMTNDYPLGVSNRFEGRDASVTVRHGALLLVFDETPAALAASLQGQKDEQMQ